MRQALQYTVPIRQDVSCRVSRLFQHRQFRFTKDASTMNSDATKESGIARSELYRQLAVGTIRAVKLRLRTLIVMDSLREFIANLPAATFRS
jgi:hypothetical protein